MNKNQILFEHPIVGYITFTDLIQDLDIMIYDFSIFESIIIDILKYSSEMTDEDIATLFNLFPINNLKWIRDLLISTIEKEN